MTKPETYWEDRARETENMLRRVCDILVKHANPHMVQDLFASRDAWQDVIAKLDADWKAKEKPVELKPDSREPECMWKRFQFESNMFFDAIEGPSDWERLRAAYPNKTHDELLTAKQSVWADNDLRSMFEPSCEQYGFAHECSGVKTLRDFFEENDMLRLLPVDANRTT